MEEPLQASFGCFVPLDLAWPAAGGGDELLLDLRRARRRGAQSTIEHQHAVGATTQSSLHTLLFAAAFIHTQTSQRRTPPYPRKYMYVTTRIPKRLAT
ncbi:MAG TPA: hypothetical protein VJ820_02040 [Propionibacteriaceae bacterium]|nr:hypothetical protein [Propionibacteriaceae bacterium]